MAAALHQQPLRDRVADGAAEIDPGDGAAGARAGIARPERDREGRPAEPLLEPRGDEPDHAGVPARRRRHHHRAALLEAERRHRLGLGFRDRGELDGLALAVEAVELGGEAGGFGWVLAQQQPRAEIGAADPPAGVDARPQHEAEVPRLRRPGEPRHVDERGEPDPLAPPHRDQPLGDEGAVEPLERHHVGDGAERDEIDEIEEVGLRPRTRSRSRAGAARG